jgi:hypothetical protein
VRLARPRMTGPVIPTKERLGRHAVPTLHMSGGGGWRMGKAERQRMRCHRIPTWLDRLAGVRQFLGRVLKNANTYSMQVQLTLIPGSLSRF